MRKIDLSRAAEKALAKLSDKHHRQVSERIRSLASDPQPHDSGRLKGYPCYRLTVGEYRVIYTYDASTVTVALIGKRNDDEVYRALRRR